ncbi:MAG: hypothetical protein U0795_12170 [Pirellulales bacterium]
MDPQRSSDHRSQLRHDPIGHFPAATVACFDPTCGELPRRQLDADRFSQLLEAYQSAGVESVLIAASTGHGHLRTPDELADWFTLAHEIAVPRLVKLALLRPEDGLQTNLALLDQLAAQDYLAVFFRPGTDLRREASVDEQIDQLQPLLEAASQRGLPTGLYSIPDVSGVPLHPEAAARLAAGRAGESLVAIKVTEADYDASTRRFLATPGLERLKIVQGWDTHLARALQDGPQFDPLGRPRCGITSGPMGFAVYQYQHLLAAAARHDWPEVALAGEAVSQLFRAMQDDPGKFADLQRAKYVMGLGQPLLGTVTTAQAGRLLQALESLPREADRQRLARSLNLLGDGPYHQQLTQWSA